MTTVDDREFLPAMGSPSTLRYYDMVSRLMGARDLHWQLIAQAGVEPGATVLEIGCGTGNVLVLAARVYPDTAVVGLDPDAEALAIAARKTRRAGLAVRLERGYADRLPFADGSVDRVLSSFMLHHLPPAEQQAALREAHRVLAPGGRLHLLDFAGGRPTPPRVMRLLHRRHDHTGPRPHVHATGDTATALAEAGFTDVALTGRGTTAFGAHTFHRAVR